MRMRLASLSSFAAVLFFSAAASATANYVYHEQTTSTTGGSCAPFLTTPAPASTDTYPLAFRIEYQFFTDNAAVYYTTDGSAPSGAFGAATSPTTEIAASYACTYDNGFGQIVDVATGTIPAQPAGTTVKYVVSAWHSGGGAEIFANSGTCTGCGDCESSSCATVFSYVVEGLDAGIDASADVDAADAISADSAVIDTSVTDTAVTDTSVMDTAVTDTAVVDTSAVDTAPETTVVDSTSTDVADTSSVDSTSGDASTDAGADTASSDTHVATDSALADGGHDGADSGAKTDSSSGFDATVDSGSSASAGNDSSGGCGCEIVGAQNHREFPSIFLFMGLAAIGVRRVRRASPSR